MSSFGSQMQKRLAELRRAQQDIPAIIAAGLESGAQWFIVEQDRSSERPALDAAKMSCDYVRSL